MNMQKWKGMARACLKIFGLFVIVICVSCGRKSQNTGEGKSLSDLENAITVIRVRRESEHDIISQEEYAISVLTDNIEKANSEGMKNKIREEIVVKRAVITKAEKNIANQDLILKELTAKRDSIENAKAGRIE